MFQYDIVVAAFRPPGNDAEKQEAAQKIIQNKEWYHEIKKSLNITTG